MNPPNSTSRMGITHSHHTAFDLFFSSSHQPSMQHQQMSFPDLIQAPEDFLVHVNAFGLDSISTAFVHYQKRPIQSAGGRYDEDSAEQWCECMDTLLVSSFQF